MLAEKKTKCVYCSRSAYFYVFTENKGTKTAIYTQCPNCKQYADCFVIAKGKAADAIKDVLSGKDPKKED